MFQTATSGVNPSPGWHTRQIPLSVACIRASHDLTRIWSSASRGSVFGPEKMTFVGSAWALLTGHMSDFVLIIYLSAYLKLFIRGMWRPNVAGSESRERRRSKRQMTIFPYKTQKPILHPGPWMRMRLLILVCGPLPVLGASGICLSV